MTESMSDDADKLAAEDAALILKCPGGYTERSVRVARAYQEARREIEALQSEVEQCHAKSTCCCGSYVNEHGIGDGHSPVSMYDYALSNAESVLERTGWRPTREQIARALARYYYPDEPNTPDLWELYYPEADIFLALTPEAE